MKITFKHIIIICILLLPSGLLKTQIHLPEGAEEGLFTLKYSYFSLDVSTVIYKDSVFIPFSDFLNMLKIYNEGAGRSEIKGYVFNKDSSFALNTSNLTMLDINNNTNKITEHDFVKTNLETFVLPSILERIFNISVYVKTKQLKIHIVSDYKFPILLEDERLNKYSGIKSDDGSANIELPLLYDRNWTIIDGGMLDYSFSGSQMSQRQSYGFGGNIGFQLLGGDMQYNINTSYDVDSKLFGKNENYRWRYNFSENNYISQIAVGSIYNMQNRGSSILSMVSNSRSLNGIQISNESIRMPSAFTTFKIQDKIQPNWQVELYVADKLYAQTVSDNIGFYEFELPIKYGNTNVEIKIYGPHGEFISKKDIISIPSEILVPGEIKYNLGAGQDIQTKKIIGNGLISIGLTDWFTNTVNIEGELDAKGYTLVDNSSIRLMNSLLINTSISPDKFYKGGLRILFEKAGVYDFIYSMNKPNEKSTEMIHSIDVTGGLPRLFDLPINIAFRGNRTESSLIASNTGNMSLAYNFDNYYISTRYTIGYNQNKSDFNNNLNQNINFQIDYSWYKKPDYLSFLGNTRFSLNSGYIFNTKQITNVGFTISQEIAKVVNINFSNQYNPSSNLFSTNLSVMLNTSYFRMNTSMQSSQGYENSFSENITGSINYDSKRSKLFMSNAGSFNSSSSGGASIRFYVDNNESGKYDEGDLEVEDGVIYVPGATIEKDNKGLKRVLNLLPGGRYNLYVKPGSFKNPYMMPKITEFSFIADPNSMKSIDIPCFLTGMIEGEVTRIDSNNTKEGQAGVKIHIVSKNNPDVHHIVPVFSDGTFYKSGLIPDSYIAYIDSIQQDLLNTKSNPSFLEFVINVTTEGDYVGDLNFSLSDNDSIIKQREEIAIRSAKMEAQKLAIKERQSNSNSKPSIISEEIAQKNNSILDTAKLDAINPDILAPKITDPIVPGVLRPLNYTKSKATFLAPGMKRYLDRVAEVMVANANYELRIDGHSDSFGSLDENYSVSLLRAKEVVNYLASKGISINRMISTAHGSLKPISESKTPEGQLKNMRVELTLIVK